MENTLNNFTTEGFVFLTLEFIVKISLLLTIAWLLCYLMKSFSASIKRTIWSSIFLLVLVLPAVELLMPSYQLPVFSDTQRFSSTNLPPSSGNLDGAASGLTQSDSGFKQSWDSGFVTSTIPYQDNSIATAASPSESERPWFNDSTIFFSMLVIWAMGCALLQFKVAQDHRLLQRILSRAQTISDRDQEKIQHQFSQINLPKIYLSDEVTTPLVAGYLKPFIVMPGSSSSWSREKYRAALLHELAHVKSSDNFVRVLATLVCTIHWFNPLAWLGLKKLKEEQEKAADNFVLQQGIGASSYAQELLDIVRTIQDEHESGKMVTAMASYSFFPQRMKSILSEYQGRNPISKLQTAITFSGLLAVTVLLASFSTSSINAVAADYESNISIASDTSASEDTQAFQDILDEAVKSLRDVDVDKTMSHLTKDATFSTGNRVITGEQSLRKAIEDLDFEDTELTLNVDEVVVNDSSAVTTGTVTYRFGINDDPFREREHKFSVTRDCLVKWQKQGDRWLISHMEQYGMVHSDIGHFVSGVVNNALSGVEHMARNFNKMNWNIPTPPTPPTYPDMDFDFDFDFDGFTDFNSPLLAAVREEDVEIVEMLLKNGADPNQRGMMGQTALHVAVKEENENIVKLLLKEGADPNIKNQMGQTPLYYASSNGNSDLVEILIKEGAKP